MKKVRVSVFETNSSSMHSLSIGSDKKMEVLDEEKKEEIVLGTGEYGWGPENLTTWLEKADYLAVDAINREDEKEKGLLLEALSLAFPNATFEFALLDQDEDDEEDETKTYSGYLDHESVGTIWSELDTVEKVFKVLFGNSIIVVDNDNH